MLAQESSTDWKLLPGRRGAHEWGGAATTGTETCWSLRHSCCGSPLSTVDVAIITFQSYQLPGQKNQSRHRYSGSACVGNRWTDSSEDNQHPWLRRSAWRTDLSESSGLGPRVATGANREPLRLVPSRSTPRQADQCETRRHSGSSRPDQANGSQMC